MKSIILSAIFLLTLWLFAGNVYGADAVKAPQFIVKDIFNKQVISLDRYKGKIIIIDFWATWCPPCRLEIPDIIKLFSNYSNRLQVIGLSVDSTSGPVKDFYAGMKMNYPVGMSTPEIINEYGGVEAIPTAFIIDRNGVIVDKFIGYRDYSQFEAEIKKLLK